MICYTIRYHKKLKRMIETRITKKTASVDFAAKRSVIIIKKAKRLGGFISAATGQIKERRRTQVQASSPKQVRRKAETRSNHSFRR